MVTGAGSGIGLATAKTFSAAGASIVLADVKKDSIERFSNEIIAAGGRALAIVCDVSDMAQVKTMIEKTVSTFGSLDMAFNNAGVSIFMNLQPLVASVVAIGVGQDTFTWDKILAALLVLTGVYLVSVNRTKNIQHKISIKAETMKTQSFNHVERL